MKRFLSLLLIIALTAFSNGCISGGGGGGGGSDAGGSAPVMSASQVNLSFDLGNIASINNADDTLLAKIIDFVTMVKACYAAFLYDFVTSLHIEVTGSGMSPIIYDSEITSPSSSLEVTLSVPNGSNRRFYIELSDRNGFILYSGVLIIDIGDYQGTPQDVSIDVSLDEGVSAQDYVALGRAHLESHDLELAYIAFDTAISLDTDHPEANFFRGFTHLLLLIQKDDPTANAASPNADIASMLSLYTNLPDIYTSVIPADPPGGRDPYTIAPDLYDENYGEKFEEFVDYDWSQPTGTTTDSAVNVWGDVMLPELDSVIADLSKASADPVFLTTITTGMHFDIAATVKVDRADVYLLEMVAYGLKAYFNHLLAYNLRTDMDYWGDELGAEEGAYKGLQTILNNDPGSEGEELFDFASGSSGYLASAKSAYSTGLDKFKAGLLAIKARSVADKNREDHIFNVAHAEDNVNEGINKVNIDKVVANIDELKSALAAEATITGYNDYEDTTIAVENNIGIDLSTLFASPSRDSLPEFYYHSLSDTDLPIFDTNNLASSSALVDALKGVLVRLKKGTEETWTYMDTLEDLLRQDLLPDEYKFEVPEATTAIKSMDGTLADWVGIRPVMFDEEDENDPANRDLTEVYMAKGYDSSRETTYLYIALRFRGAPYTGFLEEGEYINYHLAFNVDSSSTNFNEVPVLIELRGYSESWEWHLWSYGVDQGIIPSLGSGDYTMGELVLFRLPLTSLPATDEVYVGPSLWSYVASQFCGQHVGDGKLADLNIGE